MDCGPEQERQAPRSSSHHITSTVEFGTRSNDAHPNEKGDKQPDERIPNAKKLAVRGKTPHVLS
jgi:hypothetical protein